MQVCITVHIIGVYDPLYSAVHPMKYLGSDVMWCNYILSYSNPSIHCCDNSNKQTRYKMSSEHPIITYASFQTTMPVITIAARISTTPPIAPPTSAAMLTEGCATEVGEEHICLLKRPLQE